MKSLVLSALISLCVTSAVFAQPDTSHSVYNKSVQSTIVLKTDTTSIGQKIAYPCSTQAEVTGLKVIIPAGKETGWHKHSVPGYAYVIRGVLTVEMETGAVRIFKAGTSFAEVVGTMHNGINKGSDDVELIAFFTGEKGKSITIRK